MGLLCVIGCIMCAFAPLEWWHRLILAVTLVPLVVLSVTRFYGNHQMWDWGCEASKDERKTS